MAAAPPAPSPLPIAPPPDQPPDELLPPSPAPHLLASLTRHSHAMAEHLASLTRHFDLCVTAVRTTEGGGPALARWKADSAASAVSAASVGQDAANPVSISGVIAEQEATTGLEPISAQERAEMLQVVLQDAAEVDDVVADMAAELHAAEAAFAAVHAHAEQARVACAGASAALRVLEEIGGRLPSYAAAESEFEARWANERAVVTDRLVDMDELRAFYEGYAHAYDTLILEAERRRTVDAKIQTVWRKARDAVERLAEADRSERASFRQEVGDFLPTDLWVDMDRPPRGAGLLAAVEAQPDAVRARADRPARKSDGGGGDDSVLDEANDKEASDSRGPGGSSTRTVVAR